jgi:hypothetical protein
MPTIADYLNDLTYHKNSLAETLQNSGVEASTEETFSMLVPKANEKIANSKNFLVDKIQGTLTKYESDEVTIIADYALASDKNLTEVSFPNATEIGRYAFYECSKLTTVNCPKATIAKDRSFSLTAIERISLPNLERIETAFVTCKKLIEVDIPKVTYIDADSFAYCSNCEIVNMPSVEYVHNRGLGQFGIKEAILPNARELRTMALQGCKQLTKVSLTRSEGVWIGTDVFKACIALEEVTIVKIRNAYDDGDNRPNDVSFVDCINLTKQSAKNIAIALPDISGTSNAYKYRIEFPSNVYENLIADGNTAPDEKDWETYISDKGWLT